jgi:hypothetical protein
MVINSTSTPYFFKSTIEIEKFDNGIWVNALKVVEDSLPIFTIEPFDTIYYSVTGNENSSHLEINDPTLQNLINNNTFYLDNGYRFRLQPSYSNDGVTWFNTMPEITHEIMSNPATPITFLNKNQNDSISLNAESMVFIWEDQNAKSVDSSYYRFTMYPWFPDQPYDSAFTQNEKIVDTFLSSSIFIWEVEPIERILSISENEELKYIYSVESVFNVGQIGYSNKSDDMVLQAKSIDAPKFSDYNNDTTYTFLVGKKYGMSNELVLNGNLDGHFDLGDPNITIHLPETYQLYPSCNTGDGLIEGNTFGAFTGKVGKNLTSALKWEQEGIFYDNTNSITKSNSPHLLVHKNTGNDVFTGLPVVSPEGGNYSVRINGDRDRGSARASSLSTKFFVDISQTLVSFRVAPVLQDPPLNDGHQGFSKVAHPFFSITAKDETTGEMIYETGKIFPGNSDYNWLYTNGGYNYTKIAYLDWQCIEIDLSGRDGHIIDLNFIVSDCIPGGHFGYMYVDAMCPQPTSTASFTLPEFLCPFEDDEVIADGSASTNVSEYMWSIGAWQNGDYVAGTYIEQLFRNGTPGEIDLRSLYGDYDKFFRNYTYKVTLKVKGRCQNWVTVSKFIYPSPTFEKVLESNYILCYSNLQEINFNGAISPTPPSGTTYSWSPTTYLDNPNIANPKFNYTGTLKNTTITYTLTINTNDEAYCVSKQTTKVKIFHFNDININYRYDYENCRYKLWAVDENNDQIKEGIFYWQGPGGFTSTKNEIYFDRPTYDESDDLLIYDAETKSYSWKISLGYSILNNNCNFFSKNVLLKEIFTTKKQADNNVGGFANSVWPDNPLEYYNQLNFFSFNFPSIQMGKQYGVAYGGLSGYRFLAVYRNGTVFYDGSNPMGFEKGGYYNTNIHFKPYDGRGGILPESVYVGWLKMYLCNGAPIFYKESREVKRCGIGQLFENDRLCNYVPFQYVGFDFTVIR